MKFPTLSKAHMQQNVNLALTALVNQGISLEGTRGGNVSPRDIVEGHREKTFGLLWKLVLNWKVAGLLDIDVLESEIGAIKTDYKRQFGMDQPDRVVRVLPILTVPQDKKSDLVPLTARAGCSRFIISFMGGLFVWIGHGLLYFQPTLCAAAVVSSHWVFLRSLRRQFYHFLFRCSCVWGPTELLPSNAA
jgi:hypothetical protein